MFVYILNKKQNGGRPRRRPIPVICPLDYMMLFYIYTDHVMFIMSLYHNLRVMSYFVAAFNNLCFTFYYHWAIAMD